MLFIVLLAIFYLLFAFLSYRNLLWGLILIGAFLPSYLIRYNIFGFPSTVLEGMILIVFGLWIVQHRRQWAGVVQAASRGKKLPNPFGRWFFATVLFLIASLVSIYIAPNHWSALGLWRAYFLEPIIFFIILISTVKNKEDAYKIIWGVVLGGIPVAALAVAQKFTGWLIPNPFWQAEATRRVTSVFGYPNAVALYLTPLLPLVVYLFENSVRKTKGLIWQDLFYSVIFFLFILAIIFTKSAGALIALAGTLIVLGLLFRRTRKFVVGLIIVGAALFLLTPLKDPIKEEFLFKGVSGQLRISMWGETVEMLRNHPIFGAGLSAYQEVVHSYHILPWAEIYLYPHNLFLNFWSEVGFVGLVAFLWLLLLFFRASWEILKPHRGEDLWLVEIISASMLIIFIQGLVDVPYFKNDLAIFFWLLMGLMAINLKFSQQYDRS